MNEDPPVMAGEGRPNRRAGSSMAVDGRCSIIGVSESSDIIRVGRSDARGAAIDRSARRRPPCDLRSVCLDQLELEG